MDVLVLSVQDQEVEEESNQESKVRQVALISVSGPNLVAETLTLDIILTQVGLSNNYYREKCPCVEKLIISVSNESKYNQKVEKEGDYGQ